MFYIKHIAVVLLLRNKHETSLNWNKNSIMTKWLYRTHIIFLTLLVEFNYLKTFNYINVLDWLVKYIYCTF